MLEVLSNLHMLVYIIGFPNTIESIQSIITCATIYCAQQFNLWSNSVLSSLPELCSIAFSLSLFIAVCGKGSFTSQRGAPIAFRNPSIEPHGAQQQEYHDETTCFQRDKITGPRVRVQSTLQQISIIKRNRLTRESSSSPTHQQEDHYTPTCRTTNLTRLSSYKSTWQSVFRVLKESTLQDKMSK